jgi:hypothetical protein
MEMSKQDLYPKEGDYTFYTKEIGLEIHCLLLGLLQGFVACLTLIARLAKLRSDEFRQAAGEKNDVSNECVLNGVAAHTALCGGTLRLLIYSSAMEVHILRLHKHLTLEMPDEDTAEDRASLFKADVFGTSNTDEEADAEDDVDDDIEEDIEEDEEEDDEDPRKANLSSRKIPPPMAIAYMRWLRLQVSHLEAVKTLCRTCKKLAPAKTTNLIKVIEASHQGTRMQPWEDLVRDLLSTSNPDDPPNFTAESVIEVITNLGRKDFFRFATGSGFNGTLHCEVCLASLFGNRNVDSLPP